MSFQSLQLPLAINLQDTLNFANFISGQNAALVNQLQQVCSQQAAAFSYVYLWGAPASGKSHLLQATGCLAAELGLSHSYLDLAKLGTPDALSRLQTQLVALDNLEAMAGNNLFEEGLFHLFNRLHEQQSILVITALASPAHLGIQLADLRSRLAWGLTYHLQPLQDEDKVAALELRAKNRGLTLPTEVSNYLITRGPRQLNELFKLLDTLDAASLQEQRKLTLPFVRLVLNW